MNQRPVYLNVLKIRFPITAFASILHRLSGVLLFVASPYALCLWHQSLSMRGFHQVAMQTDNIAVRLGIWLVLSAFIYHLVAGCRHLMMDWGFAESLRAARCGAVMVLLLAAVGSVAIAWRLWV